MAKNFNIRVSLPALQGTPPQSLFACPMRAVPTATTSTRNSTVAQPRCRGRCGSTPCTALSTPRRSASTTRPSSTFVLQHTDCGILRMQVSGEAGRVPRRRRGIVGRDDGSVTPKGGGGRRRRIAGRPESAQWDAFLRLRRRRRDGPDRHTPRRTIGSPSDSSTDPASHVTHLRPTLFDEWLTYHLCIGGIVENDVLAIPFGTGRFSPIAAYDRAGSSVPCCPIRNRTPGRPTCSTGPRR